MLCANMLRFAVDMRHSCTLTAVRDIGGETFRLPRSALRVVARCTKICGDACVRRRAATHAGGLIRDHLQPISRDLAVADGHCASTEFRRASLVEKVVTSEVRGCTNSRRCHCWSEC